MLHEMASYIASKRDIPHDVDAMVQYNHLIRSVTKGIFAILILYTQSPRFILRIDGIRLQSIVR